MNLFMLFGIILLVIFVLIISMNKLFEMQRRKKVYTKKLAAPQWADEETKKLFNKFNDAWSYKIEETVNIRVHKAQRNLTDVELRERWHELKKFLFLAGISKKLPMFSKKVDDLWHFFLDEKELYEQFCRDFIGEQIEHHPHEKPKHLPAERAWFDILYLSFFNITSHSNLWGKFLTQEAQHMKWTEKIMKDSDGLLSFFGKQTANAESINTLAAFLQFAKKQLTASAEIPSERVQRTDGYWYGAAIFALPLSYPETTELKKEKENEVIPSDGSAAAGINDDRKDDWNHISEDVNTFETGTDSSSASGGFFGGDGGSDAGSSCSSCSGCSS